MSFHNKDVISQQVRHQGSWHTEPRADSHGHYREYDEACAQQPVFEMPGGDGRGWRIGRSLVAEVEMMKTEENDVRGLLHLESNAKRESLLWVTESAVAEVVYAVKWVKRTHVQRAQAVFFFIKGRWLRMTLGYEWKEMHVTVDDIDLVLLICLRICGYEILLIQLWWDQRCSWRVHSRVKMRHRKNLVQLNGKKKFTFLDARIQRPGLTQTSQRFSAQWERKEYFPRAFVKRRNHRRRNRTRSIRKDVPEDWVQCRQKGCGAFGVYEWWIVKQKCGDE